jgi:NADPH:quinone reductase
MLKGSQDFGIVARKSGEPEVLEWTALDTAAPGPGEVRVAQHAVGVNFIDTYFRKGAYPWPIDPLIPGGEAAGIVDAVGAGVDFKVGDRVAYTLPIGAYRTRRVVPAQRLVKLPDDIDFDVAASVMLKGMTAQFLVNSCYPVERGEVVLVHAAAGGVGLLLGQWLNLKGATAIGTAGSPEKLKLAQAHGYTHVIDYRREVAQDPRHVRLLRAVFGSDRRLQVFRFGRGRVAVCRAADAVRLHQDTRGVARAVSGSI